MGAIIGVKQNYTVLISMEKKKLAKPRGRPREFDTGAALDRAIQVFAARGYEGSSLPDLTRAMGINRPSLYAAFGNKEALFQRAVQRYVEQSDGPLRAAMNLPTAREGIERLMRAAAGGPGRAGLKGCLLVNGALACSAASDPVRKDLALRRNALEAVLKQRFERAITEGELPGHADARALAKYFVTFQQGLAVQAASGASGRELSAAVNLAMQAWPP